MSMSEEIAGNAVVMSAQVREAYLEICVSSRSPLWRSTTARVLMKQEAEDVQQEQD